MLQQRIYGFSIAGPQNTFRDISSRQVLGNYSPVRMNIFHSSMEPRAIKGHGTIYIERLVNGKWLQGKLDKLYVPDLNKNLFSVGACMSKGYRITFKRDHIEFFIDNELRARGMKQDNNLLRMFIKTEH